MDINVFLATKYGFTLSARSPIEIPDTNRETLARLFHVWGFLTGAEVGVERGLYAEALCRENPGVRLLCVDAWKVHRGYRDHVDQGKLARFYIETQERLAPFAGVTLMRQFSVDAARDIADGSLDFVYIDGNHDLQSVIADLAAWTPKVRAGGIVAGHDYLHHRWPNRMHVVQAVHAWTDAYDIHPWFVLGAKEKVPGQIRDDGRSWFWVHRPRPVVLRGEKAIHQ